MRGNEEAGLLPPVVETEDGLRVTHYVDVSEQAHAMGVEERAVPVLEHVLKYHKVTNGDVLKLRPGITGPATLKYRLEDEYLANARSLVYSLQFTVYGITKEKLEKMTDQEVAVWYNDNVIYPDKVRLNCYYYRHYSFVKDIQMILCTVLGRKMKYAGEVI